MEIQRAKECIKEAEVLMITAGAGMGVDGGLPDFRSKEGFWRAYPPLGELGIKFQDLANPKSFCENPELSWAFYAHRFELYKKTPSHFGYELLLKLAKQKEDYFVITSNVDGHFFKAGFDADKIYEYHGSIYYLQCSSYRCKNFVWDLDFKIKISEDFRALNLPICPKCGSLARPNIVMFEDYHFKDKRINMQEAKFNKWKKKQTFKKVVIIEIGAGKAVPSMRILGQNLCKRIPKSTLIRINPTEADFPKDFKEEKSISLSYGGLEALKKLVDIF
ncbi:NAD-dependent deacetylase [Helicobacter valdiviensis]|uniref:protein acetyllysine N-acetyltransferase n=1 Tax=Helicobacter valdiviensis TaxID=1458358 RepID=A0A2W6PME0_9HELI|nr:Sir2 family NAD-dependent protein deacetylase [Helicobacter valdiviensis]PZT47843.1 NAD-dependent deacetylase [Helicobacter valdiviensis]